MTDLADEDRQC